MLKLDRLYRRFYSSFSRECLASVSPAISVRRDVVETDESRVEIDFIIRSREIDLVA